MSDSYRDAHNETSMQINYLRALIFSLEDMTYNYSILQGKGEAGDAASAMIAVIREKVDALSDIHDAEWDARNADQANLKAKT